MASGLAMLAKLMRGTALGAVIAVSPAGFPGFATGQDAAKPDFPIVVRCSFMGIDRVFYLSTVQADGTAVYMSPDRIAATVTATGAASKVMAEGSGSCAGKTVQELRDAGLAFDLMQ